MNEHKNIITIEDEIKEFSDKPVKSSALYKKVKELESNSVPDASEASVGDVLTKGEGGIGWSAPSGGGSSFGNEIFSGAVTDTPQAIEMTYEQFLALPKYVGTVNGKPITYMEIDIGEDGAYWYIGNEDDEEVEIDFDGVGITIAAYDGDCETELIDMGPRFVSVFGLLQADTIHIGYPIQVLDALANASCGLALFVVSKSGGAEGHSYGPISFYRHPGGNYFFDAQIRIGTDIYSDWTVAPETGAITGTTGGSNT